MTLGILIRSIFIGFLVAIPSPFIIGWLSENVNAEPNLANFFAVYALAFVGCLVMGISGVKAISAGELAADSENDGAGDGRESGKVKWFNLSKGFGFITRKSGEDIFVHYRSIRGSGRRGLKEGQKVLFKVTEGEKGLQAEDVSVKR